MPRSFYARAALILTVPIVVLQLAVAVMFLQRHYEDVTVQMTTNMAREVALVRGRPDLAGPLGIELGQGPVSNRIGVWDLSGRAMREQFEQLFEGVRVDALTTRKQVRLGFADGTWMEFSRSSVSASNPHQLLVLMVGVALLMTAISFLFMRGQIRPIYRLARAAEAFGRGQSMKYVPTGAREVRAAGTAFLHMRTRIERHIEQRTLLLSGVSHDLRTPLTRMKLELSMMEGPEAEELTRDVAAMERIIDTFLDFAHEDAVAKREPVDALDLLREAARTAPGDVEIWGVPATVDLQAGSIVRALGNLMGNALSYGSCARAGVTVSDQTVAFTVEDDGPGIPEADREAATRPFSRLDTARSNTRGNVGLGLSIVRDVARAHGGVLRLGQSETLGGLKAEIVIPI
ncbi:two-component system, OmpR family, osmolarity sensor histidine kinase EnvZ [Jannaschia seohaensis]|uniref:histidine kinase n=2 Tax=Jannaschia seohaensis TaxID=475081 RepID=A0A2Y9B630_9RHOB|nr:two-component system osmolarity sensor histidine kinase EnvZ [Jannaschia seohaensis]SSA51505.1 two-component system, OmpR family, osmolarity sensor histidine kinase EnvZ [Jannaschia seohaensis]